MKLAELVPRLAGMSGRSVSYYESGKLVRRTFPEVHADIEVMKARLSGWGVRAGMRVGLMADNCYAWIVYDLALIELGCVSVCFPPAELANQPDDALAETYDLQLFVASSRSRKGGVEPRPWLVVMGREEERSITLRQPAGEDRSDAQPERSLHTLSGDVFTLVFSSGTSGKLKCLVISRKGTEALIEGFGRLFAFRSDDAILAFLPFATFQQRWMVYTSFWYGFDLDFVEPPMVFRGFKEMAPTIFGAPPLFYETIEKRFYGLPPWKRWALEACGKVIAVCPGSALKARLRRLCFRPFHQALGGRVRLMLTGGAPTARSTFDLFEMLGLPLFEGYGLTETGYVAINLPGRHRRGTVGREVIDESVTIGDGDEILVRLEQPLSLGYLFSDPDELARTFRPDGAIATGDIGRFDADGFLSLVGRKKEIIITQGGYKLHPESLEQRLESSPDVARAVVFGGGELAGVTALIGLHADNATVRTRIEESVEALNRELPSASSLSRVVFTTEAFGTENGFLNRNLKLDRQRIYAHFRARLIGTDT